MTPERWRQVEVLFELVVDLPADERSSHLDAVCVGDPELRAEVESLLSAGTGASQRIREVIGEQAEQIDAPANIGRQFGTYRILDELGDEEGQARRLGAGSMGEVFLGHDDALDRPVALKLVRANLIHDTRFASRMQREARALAKLAHPNVVHVYEVGEHDGRFFMAMEYIDGQSLGEWIRECSPSWREILDAYLAAGEGLVAAHAAGLIHRDFKPDNILRGKDGRICVADFGLARANEGVSDPGWTHSGLSTIESGNSSPTLSATGNVMGTLDYMPLEQLRGGTVDARSDQFAFCVSLYQGLWGQRPYLARNLTTREQVLAADRPLVPSRGVVPSWLWPIIRRGLARDPERRWPDMRSLLDQLRRAPLRRRARRRATAAGVALTLALAGVWWLFGPFGEVADEPCTDAESVLADVWDDERRQSVRQAFQASKTPIADEAATRVEKAIDDWTSSWLAERAASCRATHVDGMQSAQMLDRRTICFGRQLDELAALISTFETADTSVVARSGQAVGKLPDPGACSAAALNADREHVIDPSRLEEVAAGQRLLARARAELNVGRPDLTVEFAERARAIGKSSHYPLELEARAVLAQVSIEAGKLDPGLEQLHEVALAAERAQLFDLGASLRVTLAREAAGDFAEPRLERWLIEEAQVALERVGRPDDPREVTLLAARARIAEQAGKYDAAIELYEQAWARAEGRGDAAARGKLRIGIGTALRNNGDYTAARSELEQCASNARELWGPTAPETARIEFNLGLIAEDLGRANLATNGGDLGEFDTAERHLRAAMEIDERAWGRDSIEVARDRLALASLAFSRGEVDGGCATVEMILPIYEAELGSHHDETASVINAAGSCRYHAEDFEGALQRFQRALGIQRQILGDAHPDVGSQWSRIGDVQRVLAKLDEALASYERALAIFTAALPENHATLAGPLRGQALVYLTTGQEARALPLFERALALVDPSEIADLAEIRFGLARALVSMSGERDHPRALELAEQALEGFEVVGVEHEIRAVRAWLARSETKR